MNNSNTLLPGTLLRGDTYTYTIRKALGQGSFGITYLATTPVKVSGALGELETTVNVAVKEFFMKDVNGREGNTVTTGSQGGLHEKYKEKFIRESRNLSYLNHPHIVKVLEAFEANNTAYYSMEYLEGGSLDAYIAQNVILSEAGCIEYVRQVGEALSYMHAHKMLHLDLKPGNIMLRKEGDAVLIDFGLSKQYDDSGKPETSTTIGGGTPGYAPVEQMNYHGEGFPVTMDVYALGGTFFKMFTGKTPPDASYILNEGFPAYPLMQLNITPSTLACVTKAMSPKKHERYQTVDGFVQALVGGYEREVYKQKEQERKREEEKNRPVPVNGPLPVGYVVLSGTASYTIQQLLNSDDCSYVYQAFKSPRTGNSSTAATVVLFECNDFIERIPGQGGKYEVRFLANNPMYPKFDRKMDKLKNHPSVVLDADFANEKGYGSRFVSFLASTLPDGWLDEYRKEDKRPKPEQFEKPKPAQPIEKEKAEKKESGGIFTSILAGMMFLLPFLIPIYSVVAFFFQSLVFSIPSILLNLVAIWIVLVKYFWKDDDSYFWIGYLLYILAAILTSIGFSV